MNTHINSSSSEEHTHSNEDIAPALIMEEDAHPVVSQIDSGVFDCPFYAPDQNISGYTPYLVGPNLAPGTWGSGDNPFGYN